MALGFLIRPRSKKRCVILSISAVFLWLYSPAGIGSLMIDYFSRPAVYSQMLDHLQQPLCPRFHKYDRQKLLLLEPNECTPLESQHPDFSADICFSPYTCNEGLVRVRRRDRQLCKEANLRYPISGNATHDAFHRQFSGPDAFHVVFSGSEKLSPPDWYHAGQCLYVFPFHISNPGKLSLDITHLYDKFDAVVEENEEWPVLRDRKILSNLPLEICRGCPSRMAQPQFPVFSDKSADPTSERMKNLDQPYSQGIPSTGSATNEGELPLCSKTLAVQGAWLPAHTLDKQSWRKANYTWTPLGCTFGTPLDKKCLQRKRDSLKILFQGDSQLRVALEQLVRRLNEITEDQTTSSAPTSRMNETFGSITFTYVSDPVFAKPVSEKSDILVANMGQWATGTKFLDNLMSTAKYHDRIQEIVESIQQHVRDSQDLEDEDLDVLKGGDNDGSYGVDENDVDADEDEDEDEDDDEDDLENEREMERLKRQRAAMAAKELEDIVVYWDDETEEEQNVEMPWPPSRPAEEQEDGNGEEEEEQDEQGEQEDTEDKPKPPYPSNRFLRQSKHIRLPGQIKASPILGNGKDDVIDERVRSRLGHAAQKNVIVKDGSRLVKNKDSDARRVSTEGGKHRFRARPARSGDSTSSRANVKVIEGKPINREGQSSPILDRLSDRDAAPINSSNSRTSFGSDKIRSGETSNQHDKYIYNDRVNENNHDTSRKSTSRYSMKKRSLGHNAERNSRGGATASTVADNIIHRRGHPGTPDKIVWAGMVAFPETQPTDPLFRHDWRTIYRLRYWNQIAEDVMLLHNVPFMDFFSMTLSMLDTSRDRSHYFGNDAAEAMLEELAFKLGLCDY